MKQHTLRCIYEFQECENDLNCMKCKVKKAYYDSLKIVDNELGKIVLAESPYRI